MAPGCGGAGGSGAAHAGQASCDEGDLPGCERALSAAVAASAALERPIPKELVLAYVAARRDADDEDAWVTAYDALAAGDGAFAAVVIVGKAPSGLGAPPKGAVRVDVGALPPLGAMSEPELWLALGESTGLSHLVVAGAGRPVQQLFPRDPLGPFLAGLAPAIAGGQDGRWVVDDLAIARELARALSHARAFDYVSAAGPIDALRRLVAARDRNDEAVLRARYALQLLGSSGVALEIEDDGDEDDAPSTDATGPVSPRAGDTAYGDLLRVMTTRESVETWRLRKASILAALPASRRDAMSDYMDPPPGCGPPRVLPFEGPRDLIFTSRVVGALADPAEPATDPTRQLALPEWFEAYRRVVAAVDQTGTTWGFAPSLLHQRGEQRGLSPETTDVYRRVTELAKRHVDALQALERANPGRFASFSLLGLTSARGALSDARLQAAVIQLVESAVRDQMAHATDASGAAEALLTGVLSGMSYPPAIQGAHYLALQSAFTAKLRGDLAAARGWGAAGLYAADALYRLVAEQAPNLPASARDISRALSDPSIELPALAALATAGTRYAVLGAEGNLSAEVLDTARGGAGGVRPDRVAARDAIKEALENLGAPGEATPALVEEIADLADGFIASAVVAAIEGETTAAACADDARWAPPQKVRRALDKLADKRTRILGSGAYKDGDGLWVRRVRLLVTVLSDAIDVMRRGDGPARFAVADAAAVESVRGALREWDEPAAVDALSGGYGLARRVFSASDTEAFLAGSGEGVRELLAGLAKLLHDGEQSTGLGGATLLAALQKDPTPLDAGAGPGSLPETFLRYARTFYEADQAGQGDLMLMAWLTFAAILQIEEIEPAVRLAEKHQSQLLPALLLGRVKSQLAAGSAVDVSGIEAPLRKVSDAACAGISVDEVLAVLQAAGDFRAGRRDEARRSLDRVLDQAADKGLNASTVDFHYQESTRTRIFTLHLGLSPTAGLLSNANTLQLGLGLRTDGPPSSSLTLSAPKPSDPKALGDAGMLYVRTAALASVFHFVEGDGERGSRAAQRAAHAGTRGVKLGPRVVRPEALETSLVHDARGTLAVAAQLAAEDGRPFLAGDLWALARPQEGESPTDETVAGLLDPPPIGLVGVAGIEPVLGRAETSLGLLTASYPCVKNKPKAIPSYAQATCKDYPLALSLRIADGLSALPRLRRGPAEDAACGAMAALDAFLGERDAGNYDPDRFMQAVTALKGAGRAYDAAALLTRQRNPAHCSPTIVAIARELGHGAGLSAELAADVLSAAVNCSVGAIDQRVLDDFVAIDGLTRDLADPTRGFTMLLFAIELALQKDEPRALAALTSQPGFVERWMGVSALTGISALIADHAASLLSGKSPATQATAGDHRLLCEIYPPTQLGPLCKDLTVLRDPKISVEDRAQVARGSLRAIQALVTGGDGGP